MSMRPEDHDEAMIFCERVEDLATPVAGSERAPCSMCGVEVWVDPALLDEAATAAPSATVRVVCASCLPPMNPHETWMSAPQLQRLLDRGMTPLEVAHVWAMVLASHGSSLPETHEEILRDPVGTRASEYAEAFRHALVLIHQLLTRN